MKKGTDLFFAPSAMVPCFYPAANPCFNFRGEAAVNKSVPFFLFCAGYPSAFRSMQQQSLIPGGPPVTILQAQGSSLNLYTIRYSVILIVTDKSITKGNWIDC